MIVKITPIDTLFVRDSRKFGVTEGYMAGSVFPPPPSTMFGAMRGSIYRLQGFGGRNPDQWFGDATSPGQLCQAGPLLLRSGESPELLCSVPADLVHFSETSAAERLKLHTSRGTSTADAELPYVFVPPTEERLKKPKGSFLCTGTGLQTYLSGNAALPASTFVSTESIWHAEQRTNVSIDSRTNAAMDAHLFSLRHIRLQPDISLVAQWATDESDGGGAARDAVQAAADQPFIKLGGENKYARLATAAGVAFPDAPDQLQTDTAGKQLLLIYFATPGWFEDGSLPPTNGSGGHTLQYGGAETKKLDVELLAAAIGKPFVQGGYNIQTNQQRRMHRFVPAGSVFYCRIATNDQSWKQLHGKTIGDNPMRRAQGYGLVFVGTFQLNEVNR